MIVGTIVGDEVVPLVNSTLINVVSDLTTLTNTIVPIATGLVFPLVEDELAAVPEVLNEVLALVSNIKSTLTDLVGAVAGGK